MIDDSVNTGIKIWIELLSELIKKEAQLEVSDKLVFHHALNSIKSLSNLQKRLLKRLEE